MISFSKWITHQKARADLVGSYANMVGDTKVGRGRITRKTTMTFLVIKSATAEVFAAANSAWDEYERVTGAAAPPVTA